MDEERHTRDACCARHACGAALRNGTVWTNAYNRTFAEEGTGCRWKGLGRLHGDDALSSFVEIMHIYGITVWYRRWRIRTSTASSSNIPGIIVEKISGS